MKQRGEKKGGPGKARGPLNKKHHRNKKGRDIRPRKSDDDSDLSDIEAEYLEDIPENIAKSINKLAFENDQESYTVQLIEDAAFLENDPLVSGTLKDIAGFLPDDYVPETTAKIGKLSERLFNQGAEENEKLRQMKEVYTEIGVYLSKYKSGGLPKAFKVVPKLKNWEEVLDLTAPHNWTANAMYEVTHLFASNMTESMVEIFYSKVLLPTVRRDIHGKRKLNYHLYMALKKAVFKPMAWFKGILVPLVEEGCTYREAAIIGNVVRRISIPVLHASAFIIRICQCQKWFGSSSFILSILLQKKYNLPRKVVEDCVSYFSKFESFEDQLPVIWHQSLLTLVTIYSHNLSEADREAIQRLTRVHHHPHISPAIHKVLSCTIAEVEM